MKEFFSLFFLVLSINLSSQDTQWRGPERDGKYPDTGLLRKWPENGPELILKKEGLGKGYSTPVLYKGSIFISGKQDSLDVMTKLDLQGNILWETVFGLAWVQTFPDSRNTPAIENGWLYIMGGMGTVVCMDTDSGEIVWSVNTHDEFEGEFSRWGMAESLLLTENAVISSPVGSQTAVLALDKRDGSLLWKTASIGGTRAYASPLLIDHNGRRMILAVSSKDLIGVDLQNGKVIWTYDTVTGHSKERKRNNTNTPVYYDGSIFATCGYDADGIMLSLSKDGSRVELKWSDPTLDTHHGGTVLLNGYLYGSNWISNGMGNWVCQEWETGKVMYDEEWHNKGSIIYADGLLYIYEEKSGNVGLIEPTPERFRVISSFTIEGGTGPHWAHMSIYDKKLLIRHGEELFVYNIAQSI